MDSIRYGGQIAHKGIQFSPGNGFERLINIIGREKIAARINPLHQVLGNITLDNRDPAFVKIQHPVDKRRILPGDNNHGKTQIRFGEEQKLRTIRSPADTRQNVDVAESGFFHRLCPADIGTRSHVDVQLFI